jgi:AcrR family transcriptional regulator
VHNTAVILTAATDLLGRAPMATMEEIATAAGVSRQTLYAHFPTRGALVDAMVDRVTGAVVAALNGAALADGPAGAALDRWLDTCWSLLEAYPVLLQPTVVAPDPQRDSERHLPIAATLLPVLRRGQRAGEFDQTHPPAWLLTAIIALGHAAGQAAGEGRLTARAAGRAFRDGVRRLVAPAR